jgi:adenine-specific DNA-methyltransferase
MTALTSSMMIADYCSQDEKSPKTLLYPRDPSLDPQLVWKGKDEQDSKDLAVFQNNYLCGY